MTWWRHNSVTVHVTKFYFIQLVLKIKYVDIGLNFLLKTLWKCDFFWQKTLKRIFHLKIEKKRKLDDLVQKFRTTGLIERTVMVDFKMCCLYVVLVLPGSVETELGW